MKSDPYHLHFKDEEIPWSPTAWLNDHVMDAVQKSICKKLGADDDYQWALNVEKRWCAPLPCGKKWKYPTTSWGFWTLAPYIL